MQQTCEKRLKVLLVSRGIRPPRSHRIGLLVAQLRGAGCELPGFQKDWTLLSDYSATRRYPERQIGETEARAAAERVAAAVLAAMKDVLAALSDNGHVFTLLFLS